MRNHSPRRGFTLIELMIVVVILGLIAAVAIPEFMRYVRRSKSNEALINLRSIFDSAASYFSSASEGEYVNRTGVASPRQFPNTQASTPADRAFCEEPGRKFSPRDSDWVTPTWQALHFAVSDPHYFKYAFASAGLQKQAIFTAQANGDMDCDGQMSTFERVGSVDGAMNVVGGGGIYVHDELE